jgi:hypothetical protein
MILSDMDLQAPGHSDQGLFLFVLGCACGAVDCISQHSRTGHTSAIFRLDQDVCLDPVALLHIAGMDLLPS